MQKNKGSLQAAALLYHFADKLRNVAGLCGLYDAGGLLIEDQVDPRSRPLALPPYLPYIVR